MTAPFGPPSGGGSDVASRPACTRASRSAGPCRGSAGDSARTVKAQAQPQAWAVSNSECHRDPFPPRGESARLDRRPASRRWSDEPPAADQAAGAAERDRAARAREALRAVGALRGRRDERCAGRTAGSVGRPMSATATRAARSYGLCTTRARTSVGARTRFRDRGIPKHGPRSCLPDRVEGRWLGREVGERTRHRLLRQPDSLEGVLLLEEVPDLNILAVL